MLSTGKRTRRRRATSLPDFWSFRESLCTTQSTRISAAPFFSGHVLNLDVFLLFRRVSPIITQTVPILGFVGRYPRSNTPRTVVWCCADFKNSSRFSTLLNFYKTLLSSIFWESWQFRFWGRGHLSGVDYSPKLVFVHNELHTRSICIAKVDG